MYNHKEIYKLDFSKIKYLGEAHQIIKKEFDDAYKIANNKYENNAGNEYIFWSKIDHIEKWLNLW